jgi:hypothetical protein
MISGCYPQSSRLLENESIRLEYTQGIVFSRQFYEKCQKKYIYATDSETATFSGILRDSISQNNIYKILVSTNGTDSFYKEQQGVKNGGFFVFTVRFAKNHQDYSREKIIQIKVLNEKSSLVLEDCLIVL